MGIWLSGSPLSAWISDFLTFVTIGLADGESGLGSAPPNQHFGATAGAHLTVLLRSRPLAWQDDTECKLRWGTGQKGLSRGGVCSSEGKGDCSKISGGPRRNDFSGRIRPSGLSPTHSSWVVVF